MTATASPRNTHNARPRRSLRARNGTAGMVMMFCVPMLLAACSSKDSNTISGSEVSAAANNAASDVGTAVSNAASDVGTAISNATDGSVSNADEGQAKDLGKQVVTALQGMSSPGEPLMANIAKATAVVMAPNKVTGLEDTDKDGKDDDAKFTIEANGGNDKACVQSQNGAWEVTDNEC